MPRKEWADARNILCVRLDSMGDVLMTEPALRAVKSGGRQVTLLTSLAGAEVAALLHSVDGTICHAVPWMKSTILKADSQGEHRLIRHLRAMHFDAAVIFTVYSQNPLPAALACYLADIPLRLAHCRENPYQLLTDWLPDPEPHFGMRHEVQRQLDLVASVGCKVDDEAIHVAVPQAAREQAQAALADCGLLLGDDWLLIHPGASAPSRRYPPDLFARTADLLWRELGYRTVFTGSAGEQELVEQIRGRMSERSYSLAGKLDLPMLAAVLESSPLLVANNTGPVHLAAGVGTPVVDLYALTNPQHTPWRVPSRVLCHEVPCKYCYKSVCPAEHHDCLRRVPPESIVAAAAELFALRRQSCFLTESC
jgi:lipopolysaccharide heptosyltransferase II